MAKHKTPTPDEIMARTLRPSPAYAAAARMLHDTRDAARAFKSVTTQALDDLEVDVHIRCEDPDPSYDADISLRSRRAAELAIGMMAESFDSCASRLHADTIAGLTEDLERALVSVPADYRTVAASHGVLDLWHEAAAGIGALANVVTWSSHQDSEWVEWFTGAIAPEFFAKSSRVDGVLDGLDQLPCRGKASTAAAHAAEIWAAALLRSPSAAAHLNALGVHEHIKGTSRPAMRYLTQKGWAPDPSCASWPAVLSLQRPSTHPAFPFGREIQMFLDTHLDALATAWPEMTRKPASEISAMQNIEKIEACMGISLWHLLENVASPIDRTVLTARLQAHALRLDTPDCHSSASTPRF